MNYNSLIFKKSMIIIALFLLIFIFIGLKININNNPQCIQYIQNNELNTILVKSDSVKIVVDSLKNLGINRIYH